MRSHKMTKNFFNTYLPKNYKRQICQVLGIEYTAKNEQKIYRVRVGIVEDEAVLNALIDLAVGRKKAQNKILKKVK